MEILVLGIEILVLGMENLVLGMIGFQSGLGVLVLDVKLLCRFRGGNHGYYVVLE